ncbi:unnamed protein product [Lactuca saligna]|uniref:Uncharacterized protein n=1 Tax=Lactuca saligna TaxID=75948 RepID=A0AA35YYV2_LACSI|nr:unnamed protein product [Lactuca saligna]
MKERRRSSLPRHGKGSWDEEKKEKVQGEEISRGRIGEMSSKELVKTRFFSTGHRVKLEGSMNYAKGKSWALLLSIYKWRRRSCGDSWSRQRAPLEQKAASCKHYSKSSELRNKSEASRGSLLSFSVFSTFQAQVPVHPSSFQRRAYPLSDSAGREQEGVVVRRPSTKRRAARFLLFAHKMCRLGEEKQSSPAYLPSISIGGNGRGFLPCYQKRGWVKQTPSLDEHGLSQVEPGCAAGCSDRKEISGAMPGLSICVFVPTSLPCSYRAGQERPSFKLREAIPLENRRCKSIQIDRGVPNQQQALSNVLGEGSAGESPIDPIFLIAPHSSRPGTKKSLRWADANLDLSTEQFHSSLSLNPIFNVPSPPCPTPSIFLRLIDLIPFRSAHAP